MYPRNGSRMAYQLLSFPKEYYFGTLQRGSLFGIHPHTEHHRLPFPPFFLHFQHPLLKLVRQAVVPIAIANL